MSLELTAIDSWVVHVPLQAEWASSPEFGAHEAGMESSRRLIVRIRDADGFSGWGEGAVALSEDDRCSSFKQLLRPGACRAPLSILPLWETGGNYWLKPEDNSRYSPPKHNIKHRLRHPLQKVCESAIYELLAKRAGVRLCELWGGPWRDSVLADYWMGRVTPEHAERCARRALELGFRGVKLKTTLEDPNVERLEAIRNAAGESFKVTVDPNGRFYRLDDAMRTLEEMDAIGNMAILEDPFPRFHLAEFASLRSKLRARVAVHIDPPESLWSVIEARAAGGLNLSHPFQGPGEWRQDAAVADRANLPVWHGSSLDLGIGTAHQLHLAASAPNCTLPGDQVGPWLREDSLLKEPLTVKDGCIVVPDGPGLGIQVDEGALDNRCVTYLNVSGI